MDKITPASSENAYKLFLENQRNFEKESVQKTEFALSYLNVNLSLNPKQIIQLHSALLFAIAYPANQKIYDLAEQLMQKLVQTVTEKVKKNRDLFYNSGITGSLVCAQFGLILNQYLLQEKLNVIELAGIDSENSDLVGNLTHTLDSVEQELMPDDAGFFNRWQKRYLPGIKNKLDLLNYYINACMQMTGSIIYREKAFAGFQLYTQFSLDEKLLGLSLGRLKQGTIHFHESGIQKKCSIEEVFAQGKPKQIKLDASGQARVVRLARGSMASLLRETDTFTYAQVHETELHDMGNGICVALYFMIPEQKFALQSYIGFLLYKNGVPMAYGGGWLFAHQAAFGVNVLPPYRGGESANVVCQLLRLYYFRFKISQFSVDPYQIGKGNSDGIDSGAFWFYYKLGFRPMQKNYAEIAELEMQKLALDKSYKTPKKTLITLANSELYWKQNNSKDAYYDLLKISDLISKNVCDNFAGNRKEALDQARIKYRKLFKSKLSENSFLNNLLITLDALGAFEKLPEARLKKVCEAYKLKGDAEAKALLATQKELNIFKSSIKQNKV